MTYIVWHDNHTEGWARSDDLVTLEEVFDHIAKDTYGHPYVITKPVKVNFVEVATSRGFSSWTPFRAGSHVHTEEQR